MNDDEFQEDGPEIDEPDLDEPDLDAPDLDDVLVDTVEGEVDDSGEEIVGALIEGAVGPDRDSEIEDDDDAVSDDDTDEIVDLEEKLHPDDVEDALDVVLRERTAKVGLEETEIDDEPDDRGDGGMRIIPRRPGELLCSSCFLVLPRHQLADEKTQRCRDCA